MSAVLNKTIDIATVPNGGSFNLGWTGSGGAYFANATPYVLTLFMPSLPNGQTLLPGQNWGFVIDSQDAFISIQKTLFTTVPLATVLYWTVFNDPHDLDSIPNGVYSSYIANVIGGTLVTNAQTLVNDGNGAQNVIESTLGGNVSGFSNLLMKNDGTTQIGGQGSTGFQDWISTVPGANSSLTFFSDNTTFTSAQLNTKFNNGFIAQGGIILIAPATLLTGNQETGFCGCEGQAAAAGNFVGSGVNFKTNMTNVPSSITLSGGTSNNANAPTTANIGKLGFTVSVTAVAAGHFFIYRNYATVGNCLLAFDDANRTYEHHCDGCDRKDTYSYDTLLIDDTPHGLAIAHLCTCGMQECFTTTLGDADINTPLARLTQQFCASIRAERK